jgi:thiol:disulfide interchange protein DsbA
MSIANSRTGSRHALAAAVIALLAACGGQQGNEGATPAADTAAGPATAAPAAPAAPAAEAPAPAPAEAGAAAAAPASVQETTADAGGGEQLRLASAADPEPQWRFQEGQDFKVLTTAQGITGTPDKIEVAEAFWYGCGHCYQFDPVIGDYAAKLPADVRFVRIPVMWNPTNQIHARLYYTAQALGKLEEIHTAVFREIHVNENMLTKEEDIQALFGKFGVSAEDFQKTFRSFAVEGQLKRAKDLTERYQVRSVPMLIINGKYNTDAPGIKSYDNMLQVVSELVERERRR